MLLRKRILFSLFALLPLLVQAQSWAWDDGTTPYVQSPMDVVDRMLRLAEPKPGEYLIDLGSGDGRIVIEAAKRYGTRGLGVDLEPRLVKLAQENARKAGVESLASFAVQDLFELDYGSADIISAYLLPDVNLKIMPKLLRMKPGTRIVTHDYDMGSWHYDEMIDLPVAEKLVGPLGHSKVFLFVVPADVRGVWKSELAGHGGAWEFRVGQQYQVLEVKAAGGGREQTVRGTRLRGEEIRMVVSGAVGGKPSTEAFRGVVRGDRIEGEVVLTREDETRTLPWLATRTR
jgi:SAM-dependent methyltransferase